MEILKTVLLSSPLHTLTLCLSFSFALCVFLIRTMLNRYGMSHLKLDILAWDCEWMLIMGPLVDFTVFLALVSCMQSLFLTIFYILYTFFLNINHQNLLCQFASPKLQSRVTTWNFGPASHPNFLTSYFSRY